MTSPFFREGDAVWVNVRNKALVPGTLHELVDPGHGVYLVWIPNQGLTRVNPWLGIQTRG
jgi:hypothetical protein